MPLPPRRDSFRFTPLLLACSLLVSCAAHPRRSGYSGGSLRLDSETAGRMRHAASVTGARGVATSSAVKAAASQLARLAPALLALFQHDEDELSRVETFLLECVQRAEREINFERFGNRSPNSADCHRVVGVDRCGRPVSQAMELGNLKHARALACMHDILRELWPASVSIEQRYRYYSHANVIETISRAEEQRLLDGDCIGELRGTIKPDVVLHADYDLLRAILVLELKFPCPEDREPRWTKYGDKSAYTGFDQSQIYKEALGGEALLLSPRGIFE
ncbi:lipoprotein [Melittangium boletus DSM 14713]|uniref:Lipoprotein n=2 Tax=Melittangium boletus TaxID=83453 RepID=A0A250I725_9BACT|nr:lipoprotein [Melittangium boletus DSM 14713]